MIMKLNQIIIQSNFCNFLWALSGRYSSKKDWQMDCRYCRLGNIVDSTLWRSILRTPVSEALSWFAEIRQFAKRSFKGSREFSSVPTKLDHVNFRWPKGFDGIRRRHLVDAHKFCQVASGYRRFALVYENQSCAVWAPNKRRLMFNVERHLNQVG